jgi:short subunit fatty acids transporter
LGGKTIPSSLLVLNSPFLFAILLTFLTLILGVIFTDNGPFAMLKHYNKGFWTLLTFSMQMCLILVTGYALATTRVVGRAISIIIGAMGLIIVIWYFAAKGFKLNLNIVNFTFMFVGILLHRTPIRYVRAIADGTRGCSGIILQFPFYSGIMGMMKFSGLIVVIAGWFVAISNQFTYPLFTLC